MVDKPRDLQDESEIQSMRMRWLIRLRLYRPLMKLAHRHYWHFMEPLPVIDKKRRYRCQWCGIGYSVAIRTEEETVQHLRDLIEKTIARSAR